jgi:hypothetical protein
MQTRSGIDLNSVTTSTRNFSASSSLTPTTRAAIAVGMEQFGAEQRAGRLAGVRRCLGITRAAHVTAPVCTVTVVLTRVKMTGPNRALTRGFWCTAESGTRADRAAVRACCS